MMTTDKLILIALIRKFGQGDVFLPLELLESIPPTAEIVQYPPEPDRPGLRLRVLSCKMLEGGALEKVPEKEEPGT